jgi:hypothetical protein
MNGAPGFGGWEASQNAGVPRLRFASLGMTLQVERIGYTELVGMAYGSSGMIIHAMR